MTVFNEQRNSEAKYSMFMGEAPAIQEFLTPQYPIFMKLYEDMEEARWRDKEYNLSKDFAQMKTLTKEQRHIFDSNFQFQIMADSIQGRGPLHLMPYISAPELELAFGTYGSFEQLHSVVYTTILRSVYADPNEVLEPLKKLPIHILNRTRHLTKAYDEFFSRPTKKNLYFLMVAMNILEALQFYSSFACTFAFAQMGLFDGVAKNLVMIARDENYHTALTQNILNMWYNGNDPDPEWQTIARDEANRYKAFSMWDETVVQEEKYWKYLFQYGGNPLPDLTMQGGIDYLYFMANKRMNNLGFGKPYPNVKDNLPWIQRKFLSTKSRQIANQETENDAYRVGTFIKSPFEEISLSLSPIIGF